MSFPARRLDSIRALTHELAHVARLIDKLRDMPPAPSRAVVLNLVLDLHSDGTRRLRNLQQQAMQ
ncbi:MAG: hypothetical protein WD081_05495 [Gammaproteobacteria bacterium]